MAQRTVNRDTCSHLKVAMLTSWDVIHRGSASFWCMMHVPVLIIIPVLKKKALLFDSPSCIYIYIFIIQCVKACVIPCPHQPPTRGDNTVSVAQGGTATPGATKQLLPRNRVFRELYIYIIYIYIYARSIKSRDYIGRYSSFLVCSLWFKKKKGILYIYIYIYICVCVYVCRIFDRCYKQKIIAVLWKKPS